MNYETLAASAPCCAAWGEVAWAGTLLYLAIALALKRKVNINIIKK